MHNKQPKVSVFALGGLGEIGKNCYCIEYQNQIFIIDCGVSFTDETLPGIDYVVPGFKYLSENQDKIVGLFITHGHEDHIGGIPYLLQYVKIPVIYASKMAYDLIEKKIGDKGKKLTKLMLYTPDTVLNYGDISLSFIRVSHSIPDAFGIRVKTPLGSIFETGDFKIDMTPVGPHAEYEKLVEMANDGCLLLMPDSTNAERTDMVPSEKAIGRSISEIFSGIQGRIIIATFASNVYRIKQIIDASFQNNRKILIFGHSMENIVEVSRKNKFIDIPDAFFLDPEKVNDTDDSKMTILCTGSQGEPMAVLARIASGQHKKIKARAGDTVIFSSSPIPGNFQSVNNLINQFNKLGVNVISHGALYETHASGHAEQNGLKLMINLCRPKYLMPIHGEHRMQVIHCGLGVEVGMPKEHTFALANGDVLEFTNSGAEVKKAKVDATPLLIEGNSAALFSDELIAERHSISADGVFVLFVPLNSQNKLNGDVLTATRGFMSVYENEKTIKTIAQKATDYINTFSAEDREAATKALTEITQEIIQSAFARVPQVFVEYLVAD